MLWAGATAQALLTLTPHPSPGRRGLAWCVVTEVLADLSRSGQTSRNGAVGLGHSGHFFRPQPAPSPPTASSRLQLGCTGKGFGGRSLGSWGGQTLAGCLGSWRESWSLGPAAAFLAGSGAALPLFPGGEAHGREEWPCQRHSGRAGGGQASGWGSGSWLSHCQPLGLWAIRFPSLGFSFSVGERVRIIL